MSLRFRPTRCWQARGVAEAGSPGKNCRTKSVASLRSIDMTFGVGLRNCAASERDLFVPRGIPLKLLFHVLGITTILISLPQAALSGGPKYVAGTSYFNSGTAGTPLTWSQGLVNYYTDRGNLSAILPGASADAFVADAWSQWASITTVAVSAVH